MAAVTRLETLADVDAGSDDPGHLSISLRHEAVLADGRRLLLLDDRGWSSSLHAYGTGDGPGGGDVPATAPDVWAVTTVAQIEETARVVVGPDEPCDGGSQADMAAGHWAHLAALLKRQGVLVDPGELQRLPHDVVLSERLLARAGRAPRAD